MTKSLDILKQSSLRKTDFRIKVLDFLILRPHAAVRSTEIEEHLGHYDRITLYRTLKTFEEKKIIHQVLDGTKDLKYALCHQDCQVHHHEEEHAHFACNICGNTYCLDGVGEVNIKLPTNYSLEKVQLVLSGTCAACDS